MAAKIHELRFKLESKTKEANAALTAATEKAKAEGRALNDEEKKAQANFDAEIAQIKADIEVEQIILARLADVANANPAAAVPGSGTVPSVKVDPPNFEKDPRKGFSSSRDFLLTVMNAVDGPGDDQRLKLLVQRDKEDRQANGAPAYLLPVAFTPRSISATAGSDEQGAYDDRYGGFAVPTTRLPGMLQIPFEGDPSANMTQSVPMASPSIEIVSRVDKDHSSSVSGGFTVARRPETATFSATRGSLEMVTLKASSLFGLAYATEEILTDSPISFASIIDSGFRTQFPAHILNEKLRGTGGGEMLGILTALAASSLGPTLAITKETGQLADTLDYNNVLKMAARCWGYGSAIWIANHDCRPQLTVMSIPVGTSGVLIYQPSQQPGFPDMLLGRPIYYSEYAATIGDAGDLILANWSQYLEGLYQPLQSAESMHVRFLNHERAYKFWLRNCGAPWWKSALTPAKSSNTLSPFVIIQART